MLSILANPNLTPQETIDVLKNISELKAEYQKTVRHYKLDQHTLLVLTAYDKYFGSIQLPINKALFKLMLALHDIGKPLAFESGNKEKQHEWTLDLIEKTKANYPFSEEEIDLGARILKGDPVGLFFQHRISLDQCADEIREMSDGTRLGVQQFLKLLTIYFQSDVAAYTGDDGGIRFLEFLFLYENGLKKMSSEGLLLFSPAFDKRYKQLKEKLKDAK